MTELLTNSRPPEKFRPIQKSKTRFYLVWHAMRNRCQNPKNKSFSNYGARGINIDERWQTFEAFASDMQASYVAHQSVHGRDTTLERIDNELGYSPTNCRWATRSEQANNTRASRFLTLDGTTKNLSQWGISTGIQAETIANRIDRQGMTVRQALTLPPRKGTELSVDGETHTMAEWTRIRNLGKNTISDRMRTGWSAKKAVNTPVQAKYLNKRYQ